MKLSEFCFELWIILENATMFQIQDMFEKWKALHCFENGQEL